MKKRRNCFVVITDMLAEIPKTKNNVRLIEDLDKDRVYASYKAPEETLQWERTQVTLVKHIQKPIEDWHFKVFSIFSTIPIETIKKSLG